MRWFCFEDGAVAESIAPPDDPGVRGRLSVRQRAVQQWARQAALAIDGVVQHRRGIDKMTGHELPKTDVVLAGDHVQASVDIAVEWGRPLAATALAVQSRVAETLTTMGGLHVDVVDVHVASVTASRDAGSELL
jgi:uncharacterized alkaline shock family protein YloU